MGQILSGKVVRTEGLEDSLIYYFILFCEVSLSELENKLPSLPVE
jgi:hypothetical protein